MLEHWIIVRSHKISLTPCCCINPVCSGYRRTVLVLFPYDKEADILLESGGISYALQKLKLGGSREPTDEDRKMAKFVVNRINSRDTTPTRAMAGLAVQWNDLGMWCQVMKAGGADKNLDVLGQDRIIAAWNKFSFVAVRQTWVI